jgi:hypothetical protein
MLFVRHATLKQKESLFRLDPIWKNEKIWMISGLPSPDCPLEALNTETARARAWRKRCFSVLEA